MNTGLGLEIQYRLLKLLSNEAGLSQREMAKRIGVSLGIVNVFLADLSRRGLVIVQRTRMIGNRMKYRYLLTSAGMEEKTRLAMNFLKLRIEDYEKIKSEIRELAEEVAPPEEVLLKGRAKGTT
ncbi:MAG: MarR family EPS-associated transcriptional regulator [Desulfobacteraceae bacterium]|nr:MAG: MarR family EPS-associated transcriptional regulator [Desulfobacteraceae bacterium]